MPWSPTCQPPDTLVRPQPRGSVDGPTRGEAQGPHWRRTSTGFYVPTATDSSVPEQRALEQSVRLGPDGAVTGWAALRLHGATYFDGANEQQVPLASPDRQLRPSAAARSSRESLDPNERVRVAGIPCTSPERALFDHVRQVPWWEAVVATDMTIAAGLTSRRRLLLDAHGRHGWWRKEHAIEAFCAADDNSWSPRESECRLVWSHVAGLPRLLTNRPVFDTGGQLLGIPDLLDPETGLAIDYDGADHRGARPRQRDIARQEKLERHGLTLLVVVSPDLEDHDRLAARMRARRDELLASPTPSAYRRWTITQPAGWRSPRPTLDERLLVRDLRRAERNWSA